MEWVTATDENGNDFEALTTGVTNADGKANVWIFTDKASGFGDDVGRVNLHELKKLDDGKWGA